ncbi:hypothetical protein GPK34_00905 [Secundilactobacillus kimchicus]|uniref:hypothetical protein n=1 Tax=Secundilactobacillus kimchicus TaxID=528209 RepID=UPI001C039619|nr:hypothetical protein [Secundilactobacillus kimchicus]MBT9670598.1 hypothetical protein [Secundilactobacillus kimchicus]
MQREFGKGRVYGVNVRSAKSNGDYIAHFNENDGIVTIDKLMQNLKMMNNIKMGRVGTYYQNDSELNLYLKHWQNVIIRDVENDDGTMEKTISRRKDGDHYAQSSVYAMVGMNHIMDALREGTGGIQSTVLSDDPTDDYENNFEDFLS